MDEEVSHPPLKDLADLEPSHHGSSSSSRKSKKSRRKRKRDFEDSDGDKSFRDGRSCSRSESSRHHRRHGKEEVAGKNDSQASSSGLRSTVGFPPSAASAQSFITADVFHQSMAAIRHQISGKD
jgi:hypothetical protein